MASKTSPRVSLLARLAKVEAINSDSPKTLKHRVLSDLERDLAYAKENKLPDLAKQIRGKMRKGGYYRSKQGAYAIAKATRTNKRERTAKAETNANAPATDANATKE